MLKEIGCDTKQSRINEKDSLLAMCDKPGQGGRKRKAKSNAVITVFKRRRKV